MMGGKEGKLERGMRWDNIIFPLPIPTFLLCCLPSSVYPTFPHASSLASFVLTSFQPSLPPSPSVFTRLCLLPLPVAPVYEGKFIGLPGAVSWRWPPQLKPQQGFTLHMEQKQHSGAYWAVSISTHLHMLVHSHLPLSSNEHPCFLPALPFESRLAPSCSWWLVGWLLGFFSYFILLHLAFVFYWSTRSS